MAPVGEFFLEIGCEEIPARFVTPAREGLRELVTQSLGALRLAHGEIVTAGTPRRLALCVRGLSAAQSDEEREVTGPARGVGFAPDGSLTRAGEGFARSQGVPPEEITVKKLPKGEYLCALRRDVGRPAAAVLAEEAPRWVTGLRFPKSMRWGEGELRFARPIHWIVALFDGQVLEFEVEGIGAGNRSRGHRFLAPREFEVGGWDDYLRLTAEHKVAVDPEARKEAIAAQVQRAARDEGGEAVLDEELLEQVNNLVEHPVAVAGSFEEEFLEVPEEVLVTSMKAHQKYFTVRGADGRLRPRFVTVSNMEADDMGLIRSGNERVLRARLSDARFFFREDLKTPLGEFAGELEKVVYQEKLGSYAAKAARVGALARFLAAETGAAEEEDLARAAALCKADLVTQMVGEFPELQGVMGREYALRGGEKKGVAAAIYEHYLPRFAGDALPQSDEGAILSLADRIDTITAIFGIGKAPTGSEDPYGLRRHTLAVIHILRERGYALPLSLMVERAVCSLQGVVTRSAVELEEEVREFFRGRLEHLFAAAGHSLDSVRAVLAAGFDRLGETEKRIAALEGRRSEEDFPLLAGAFKRVANIVPADFSGAFDAALLREEAERELAAAVEGLRSRVEELLERGEYGEALAALATVRPAVDRFFDEIMVMVEDEDLRRNRLALLKSLRGLLASIADFSLLSA